MDKLEIYNKLKSVPEEAKKKITGGRLSGMTDIKPMWRIEKLTETFGPCGIGWKTIIKNKEIIDGANGEKIAIVDIDLYVKFDDVWSEAIEGTGGSSFITNERNGLYTSDECFKMAYTDALSVACKSLGMGADVYWGDSKYNTNEPTKEEALEYTLTFGKHKGKKLTELPKEYLEWMLGNSNDERIKKLIELATGIKMPTPEEQEARLTYIEIDLEEVKGKFKVDSLTEMSIEQMKKCIVAMQKKGN